MINELEVGKLYKIQLIDPWSDKTFNVKYTLSTNLEEAKKMAKYDIYTELFEPLEIGLARFLKFTNGGILVCDKLVNTDPEEISDKKEDKILIAKSMINFEKCDEFIPVNAFDFSVSGFDKVFYEDEDYFAYMKKMKEDMENAISANYNFLGDNFEVEVSDKEYLKLKGEYEEMNADRNKSKNELLLKDKKFHLDLKNERIRYETLRKEFQVKLDTYQDLIAGNEERLSIITDRMASVENLGNQLNNAKERMRVKYYELYDDGSDFEAWFNS